MGDKVLKRRNPQVSSVTYLARQGPRISQKGHRKIPDNRLRRATWLEHSCPVQRLFSMFPRGLPGLALLLLRASVAIALVLEDYAHRRALSSGMHGAAILLSTALCAGYLTPIAAALALLFHGLIWSRLGVGAAGGAIILFLDAMALALLGPGAYSIDSYRFGRVLVVPPR